MQNCRFATIASDDATDGFCLDYALAALHFDVSQIYHGVP